MVTPNAKFIDAISEALDIVMICQSVQIDESSLSRVLQHTKNRNIGIISASRAENTSAQNKSNASELQKKISDAGYGYVRTQGGYVENHGTPAAKEVKEHSFMIVGHKGHDKGKLLHDLKGWGDDYKQDSVLHKPHDSENASYHHITGKDKGKVEDVGTFKQDKDSMYFSDMNGGKKRFKFGHPEKD